MKVICITESGYHFFSEPIEDDLAEELKEKLEVKGLTCHLQEVVEESFLIERAETERIKQMNLPPEIERSTIGLINLKHLLRPDEKMTQALKQFLES